MSRRCPSQDGFALVELLASLTLMALFSLLLLSALGGGRDAWARLSRGAAAVDQVEAVQGLISERITHIWPVTDYMIRPTPGPDFDGRATEMMFVGTPAQAEAPAPLRRYRLSVDAGGDLVLESRSDVALDARRWSDRRVLLHGVEALDLAYFGAPAAGTGTDWLPEWRKRTAMPELVRLRLAFPDGDPRRWPDLVVHPLADIDTECRLVLATGGCVGR